MRLYSFMTLELRACLFEQLVSKAAANSSSDSVFIFVFFYLLGNDYFELWM